MLTTIEIDAIPGLVLLVDPGGQVRYSNRQFLKETGFSTDEIAGADLSSFWMPPHDELADILEQLEKENIWQKNIRHRKKDGGEFLEICSISKLPADNEDGFCLLKVGQVFDPKEDDFHSMRRLPPRTGTDISALKQTLKEVQESEKSYRNVMEQSPIAIALVSSSDARYVDVNEAWSKRAGFKRDEVIGRTSPELNVYRDLNVRKKMWEEFTRKGYVDDLELAFTNRFGDNLCSLVSARKIDFKGEECLLYISTKIDALKAAEKKLAEREENYRTILDMAPYSITITRRRDGKYLQVNRVFLRRTGFTTQEVIGRTPEELNLYANPADRERMLEILKKDGHIESTEMQFRGKDGSISDNIISMTTFRFQGEDCIISMAVDITERKKVETELAKYRKNLEQMVADRTGELETAQKELVRKEKLAVLGQLTATVSHELRNPLGVIRSSNFFLQRKIKEKEEKIDKHFRRIDEQVSLCDRIVNDLLEYTRGRSVETAVQDISSWIPGVVEQIQEQEQIQIQLDMDNSLPPIAHDPEKMQRVLINLLNNSIQAVKAKLKIRDVKKETYQPDISVRAAREDNNLVLTVCDNGIGMDEETRQKAFEPLFTTKARGTGIGLAIVKKILEDHGGSVRFESRPMEGTRISIIISYH